MNLTEENYETRYAHMESLMRRYFDACNAADFHGIASCFTPNAVHYFPPGMYGGAFRGAETVAQRWVDAVANLGSYWTVDTLVVDPWKCVATMEWSHFKTKSDIVLRGDEWYEFDGPTGLIREIRAYYASPQADGLGWLQLEGFDYRARGYAMAPPHGER